MLPLHIRTANIEIYQLIWREEEGGTKVVSRLVAMTGYPWLV